MCSVLRGLDDHCVSGGVQNDLEKRLIVSSPLPLGDLCCPAKRKAGRNELQADRAGEGRISGKILVRSVQSVTFPIRYQTRELWLLGALADSNPETPREGYGFPWSSST